MSIPEFSDTYFALLETPAWREVEMTKFQLRHRTPAFSPAVYARSAGLEFSSDTQAYRHWLEIGRQRGLEWAPGKDTLLKIVLKAKDEAYLIDAWVEHHAAIVGYENLIIFDCGSTDPRFLQKLALIARRVLVLPYRYRHYDDVHWVHGNPDFFNVIARNCRYVAVLDADEFLIGREGEFFSGRLVKPILRHYDLPVHCTTWVHARGGPALETADACPRWGFDASVDALRHGTHAGKSIARSDLLSEINYIGHNFGELSAARYATEESFGRLMLLHAKNLPPAVMQERLLLHLVAKRAVTRHPNRNPLAEVAALADRPDLEPLAKFYARTYVELETAAWPVTDPALVWATLLGDVSPQAVPALAAAMAAVDMPARLKEWREELERAWQRKSEEVK
jgi:hypothetical protein